MRIFQKNLSLAFNGSESFKDANVNITLLDVRTILHGLEKAKFSDPAEAEQAVSICSVLKTLCHE